MGRLIPLGGLTAALLLAVPAGAFADGSVLRARRAPARPPQLIA